MTDLESAAVNNVRELREALKAIREAVAALAPPGSVPNDEYMAPQPMLEAETIIRCQTALNRDPRSACKRDPSAAGLSR